MTNLLNYLDKQYNRILLEENETKSKIAAISIEIDETKKVISQLEGNQDVTMDVFSASSSYYEDKEFSKTQLEVLLTTKDKLITKKKDLQDLNMNIEQEVGELKNLISEAKDIEKILSGVSINAETCYMIDKELKEVIEKLEFCKKIAVCDTNRNVQEIDRVIRKIKKIDKAVQS